MKILIVKAYDISGDAAPAAYPNMLVQFKASDDPTVIGPENKMQKPFACYPPLDTLPPRYYKNKTQPPFSPLWLPFGLTVDRINTNDEDVV
jgi:hypothetical protein